jgi:hypothetical protein
LYLMSFFHPPSAWYNKFYISFFDSQPAFVQPAAAVIVLLQPAFFCINALRRYFPNNGN